MYKCKIIWLWRFSILLSICTHPETRRWPRTIRFAQKEHDAKLYNTPPDKYSNLIVSCEYFHISISYWH